jgi:heat shock protein HspQ
VSRTIDRGIRLSNSTGNGRWALSGARNSKSDKWSATGCTFRGIIFDIDPVFDNTEEWWQSIPAEVRPRKDQPFYHLLAENAHTEYVAYVSEQNLLPDATGQPLRHPQVGELFAISEDGSYRPLFLQQPH